MKFSIRELIIFRKILFFRRLSEQITDRGRLLDNIALLVGWIENVIVGIVFHIPDPE